MKPKILADFQICISVSLSEFDNSSHDGAVRVLSSVFIIAQSDTGNREYLISWLQKESLKQLLLK